MSTDATWVGIRLLWVLATATGFVNKNLLRLRDRTFHEFTSEHLVAQIRYREVDCVGPFPTEPPLATTVSANGLEPEILSPKEDLKAWEKP